MGVSSPTGNGEKRGPEWAGLPGTPLGLRPARAAANDASSIGTHDMDSQYAADGLVNMTDKGEFTKESTPPLQGITNAKSGTGEINMKAAPIR